MIKAVILDDEVKGSSLLQHKLSTFPDSIQVERIFNDPRNLTDGIEIFWPEVSFAVGEMYMLYRRTVGQSTFTKVGDVDPEKPFVDTNVRPNQLYEYQVKTKSAHGESKNGISKTIRRL